ncbi:hypothetical protein J6TS7_38200 [Paenibacillus dendritiformis]|uniref:copper amine oxidase N-terminal domain-containing protein n=1 Tax=Paenibacillus TaxID=44249 RepID=UPI001B15AA0E|nr:copper amine oxidase N-terminal domain-containing protein [Paenibacillus dendritiformis]GIO80210.1 hypothetical protein J6TS7_38200 [Paenibacillus dendritiformis]
MKKTVTLLLVTMLTAVSIAPVSSAAPKYDYRVRVDVNKQPIQSDVTPFIDTTTSRTYVPIRFVSEALGEKVQWNNKTKTVTVTTSSKKIELSRGKKYAYVNGIKTDIDAPAVEVQNRVMVPLRFVSEQIGAGIGVEKLKGWTYVSIAYASAPDQGKDKQEDKQQKTYSAFELDPKYNKLAPYLFKDNMRVENGELVFKVPNLSRSGATFLDFGTNKELTPGKEYRYKLGGNGYLSFHLAHKDENIEGYFVYLSPKNDDLSGDFEKTKNDVIVVNNLTDKQTASTLSDVLVLFK